MSVDPAPFDSIYPFAHEIELRPGMIVWAHRDRVEPYEDQVRKFFDTTKLIETGFSMKTHGHEENIKTIILQGGTDYKLGLIDGERRWRAAHLPFIDIIWLRIEIKQVVDDNDRFESSAVSNFCREPHTPMENACMVKRMCELLVEGKKRPRKLIAQILGKSIGWVDMHLSLNQLHPNVQALLEPTAFEGERLTLSHALLLTSLEHPAQLVLAKRIARMKLFAARHAISQYLEHIDARVQTPTGKRGPKDNYDLFANHARDMEERSSVLLKTGSATLVRMFEARKPFERDYLIEEYELAIGNAQEVLEALKNAKERAEKNLAEQQATASKPAD